MKLQYTERSQHLTGIFTTHRHKPGKKRQARSELSNTEPSTTAVIRHVTSKWIGLFIGSVHAERISWENSMENTISRNQTKHSKRRDRFRKILVISISSTHKKTLQNDQRGIWFQRNLQKDSNLGWYFAEERQDYREAVQKEHSIFHSMPSMPKEICGPDHCHIKKEM